MEKNPIEQQRIKIEEETKKMRVSLGALFDEREKAHDRIEDFILQLEVFERGGLVFPKEGIVRSLRESEKIENREMFIDFLSEALKPFIILKVTQAKIFEKIEREIVVNSPDKTKLSEVLYATFERENVCIHLASASELIKEKGIANFKKEVENGLIKLAEIIQADDKIKEVWAVSWVVAKTPLTFKKLGFTLVGDISEEERRKHFSNEERPIAEAFMKREDFLSKYG